MASEHDYHIAAEGDVSNKVNRHIWYYFIALAVLLFLTILGLDIMYRFQVDYEKAKKIGEVIPHETQIEINRAQAILSGKLGLFDGKKHVAVEQAMDRFLSDIRQGR